MPADDLDALLNPPDYIAGIEDGSANDSVDTFGEQQLDGKAERFQKALQSTRVIASFDNKRIRIPGFIVPLSANEARDVTEFFIVPYFGACLHMPPPPPNQILYSKFEQGVKVENLNAPFWFEGTLKITTTSNDTATSAYEILLENVKPYSES